MLSFIKMWQNFSTEHMVQQILAVFVCLPSKRTWHKVFFFYSGGLVRGRSRTSRGSTDIGFWLKVLQSEIIWKMQVQSQVQVNNKELEESTSVDNNRLIGQVGRVFANCPGDLGSIPGRIIQKTLKMVLDTSLLNT